ncbi:DNA-3-methyladenine glycosylase I [Ralstonia solanacearum]|uniref:DNA-3-methyladenine glycosylase I n=1 Tax=Ralstonia solanacearum TaxID=305 RepID=UPI0005C6A186|nr:DNA-3-methyladenine glycosylase I [Ralstonia solanacearum]MBB6592901.1 DNA-3-methyladenine glycosylase I [Ralstonia solanacearum]MBB6597128.1 DNA-3-methyladenine glycosylase I [Ralstonia solanacearum]MDB0542056.1 DNA-3-methyladenine glycosylase I [Ralstonia solanacearum]MDB0552371.1 DNA-3-methyladenine glycosylase I [Ralstonia solanacearum]MDB0556957.1 DNA-3-methyladenine glycosylase I [Ralstonia solanacearum]
MSRCCWVGEDPLMIGYHDTEWGTPSHDDRHLYEMLVLEGAQAGLSWQTILRKRARYQEVFDGFDPARVARFTPARIEALLADPGIVRNRAKVEAAVVNARKVLEVQDEAGSLDGFLWAFVGGRPIVNRWHSYRDAPASTEASKAMSKALAARGFKFVGPTICYAFMQATGMVDDHEAGCFRAGKAKAGPK